MKEKLGSMVTSWFIIKDEREELKRRDKELIKQQDDLEEKIIEIMDSEDLNRVDSEKGSVTLQIKSMPRVVDFSKFMDWVTADLQNRIGFLHRRVKDTAVNEMLENIGALPDGIDTYLKPRLNKRKK